MDITAGVLGFVQGAGTEYTKFLDEQRKFEMEQQRQKMIDLRQRNLEELRSKNRMKEIEKTSQLGLDSYKKKRLFDATDPELRKARLDEKRQELQIPVDVANQQVDERVEKYTKYLQDANIVTNPEEARALAFGLVNKLIDPKQVFSKSSSYKPGDVVDIMKMVQESMPSVEEMPGRNPEERQLAWDRAFRSAVQERLGILSGDKPVAQHDGQQAGQQGSQQKATQDDTELTYDTLSEKDKSFVDQKVNQLAQMTTEQRKATLNALREKARFDVYKLIVDRLEQLGVKDTPLKDRMLGSLLDSVTRDVPKDEADKIKKSALRQSGYSGVSGGW